jgi:hypothetical protein
MPQTADPPGLAELVVIARAAHLTNDREVKLEAIRQLKKEYGVTIRFSVRQSARAKAC